MCITWPKGQNGRGVWCHYTFSIWIPNLVLTQKSHLAPISGFPRTLQSCAIVRWLQKSALHLWPPQSLHEVNFQSDSLQTSRDTYSNWQYGIFMLRTHPQHLMKRQTNLKSELFYIVYIEKLPLGGFVQKSLVSTKTVSSKCCLYSTGIVKCTGWPALRQICAEILQTWALSKCAILLGSHFAKVPFC